MFIKKVTKEDFESRQNAKAIEGFSSAVTSQLCALIRGALQVPMTQSGENSVTVFNTKNYIETVSQSIPYKIGVQLDENNFIAFGVDREFLIKCSYHWGGGRRNAPDTPLDGYLTTTELAFYKRFLQLALPVFEVELSKCSGIERTVDEFDDKAIALKNDHVVHVNTVECHFHNEVITMSLIASEEALNICNLGAMGNLNPQSDTEIEKIELDLKACFEPVSADLGSVSNLTVGDSIPLRSNRVELVSEADNTVIAKGVFGSDGQGHNLLKIIE